MTGADDYLQGGLVAWTNATNYAKFVAMEKPDGDWVLELGRRINGDMVYTNADLPEGAAPDDLQLQLVSTGTAIQGRWSVDQGATWQSMGAGYPTTGLVAPKIGVAAYNGTGSQVGAFDWFRVSGRPGHRAGHLRGDRGRPRLPDAVRRHRGEPRGLEHGRSRPVHP